MNEQLKRYIELAASKFGLEHYQYSGYDLHRELGVRGDTLYTLSLEWSK